MLKVSGIDVYYGDLMALSNVGFEVSQGQIVSIIGSNGSGKSTIVRTISGLQRPKKGSVSFDGKEISRTSPSRIVELGVSQIPEGRQLFPDMTVRENLEMGAQFPEVKKARPETMEQVFEHFPRLRERMNQKAGTLSGGEQQMLAIGRGLMSRPRLLMLDEPSLGLAPILVSTIFDIIRRINEEGATILLIEQNVYNALKLSDYAYVLENGRVALSGTSQELISNPHIRKTYLGL
jgi:branched-chain amino acid transport system ATP-binding protein